MPVAEPPENLAERILRQAERRMLSGDPEHADGRHVVAEPAPSVAPRHRPGDWRVTAGVVAALAASVLLMLVVPWVTREKVALVAMSRPTAAPAAPKNAGADEVLAERVSGVPASVELAAETPTIGSANARVASGDRLPAHGQTGERSSTGSATLRCADRSQGRCLSSAPCAAADARHGWHGRWRRNVGRWGTGRHNGIWRCARWSVWSGRATRCPTRRASGSRNGHGSTRRLGESARDDGRGWREFWATPAQTPLATKVWSAGWLPRVRPPAAECGTCTTER